MPCSSHSLQIVALSGKAGSGKDYLAESVLAPMGYFRFALAWPMKNEACGHGFTPNEVHVTKPPAVRKWLQERGTERGWKIHGQDYWCLIAEAWMLTLQQFNSINKFVITDVRFPHEAEWVKRLGGIVVRIEAPERVASSGLTDEARQHSSETALDDYDFYPFYVHNDPGHIFAEQRLHDLISLYEERQHGA